MIFQRLCMQFFWSYIDPIWSYECNEPSSTFLRCVEQKWLSEIKSVNLHFFFKIVTVSLFRVIFDAEKR